ncbi:MAG: tetratricopeptide repeat protein, partial [Bacteriovoracaceae bacterium]
SLMLRKGRLLIYAENFGALEVLLKKIRALEAERSKVYYSKYLEFTGLLAVSKNDSARALKNFEKALELNENLELRSQLSALNADATQEASELINQSKAVKLIANSERHLKQNNYKYAFKDALEAARVAPNYLPTQLHLAKLQVVQSFFAEAITTLEDLYDKHPHNPEVVFALVDAYIESFKFGKVQKLLSILSSSNLRRDPAYFSKTAKYYVYKDEFAGAVAWLQKAINVNPLNDDNIYDLAKMFIRYRKYNQAKVLLSKAMDLDPANVDYRVSYADILYETESASAAIGYLYDVLRDFPDNGKILSAIGIYYYRSGQVKMFQSVKEKLLKLPGKDTALFEFLIQAAKLDEKYDDVVQYSKELIELKPGDLQARLFLGQVYMEMSKYKEALEEFNAIKERLPTYPKLQYFMSKLYLLTDNVEKATELALKEVEGNPSGIEGYLLLGEIYKKKEKYIEAEKQYKKAQQINPKNVDVLVGLAYINFMKSQYEIALDLFKKARRFEPSRAETHKLLGDVYRKIGQSSLAVESYKMFLELSPNSRYKENLQNYIRMMQ